MEVVKIVMLGMRGVVLALFLKETKPEYSLYLSLAVGICIFTFMAQKLSYLLDSVLKIQEYVPVDTKYLTILLKMIGAAYIGPIFSQYLQGRGIWSHWEPD